MRARERVSDLSPRMRELEGLIQQPRTMTELSRLMGRPVGTIKAMMSKLREKREVQVMFNYGNTTYQVRPAP